MFTRTGKCQKETNPKTLFWNAFLFIITVALIGAMFGWFIAASQGWL